MDLDRISGFPAPAGMDPAAPGPNGRTSRLPRACGDGPCATSILFTASSASPRLRGWTPPVGRGGGDDRGFPAPAGMDPRPRWSRRARPRLPRACGDGPTATSGRGTPCSASPRLRGWTPVEQRPRRAGEGFPAPAGMDPEDAMANEAKQRLPRACGDGSMASSRLNCSASASPRLRGWTAGDSHQEHPCPGFPAPAGMDPAIPPAASGPGRLPRACGDGPRSWGRCRMPSAASPRLRGWTRRPDRPARPALGFPAPAGMDPARRPRRRRTLGLPRACGDGPAAPAARHSLPRASPRLRGWTLHLAVARRAPEGFPAPAGMDPPAPRVPRQALRLPRACGDGPLGTTGMSTDPAASPRLRGPRLRGWTRGGTANCRRCTGFPAPAGMDRPRGPPRHRPPGLPRACGDGPSAAACGGRNTLASPRLRGWTRDRLRCELVAAT